MENLYTELPWYQINKNFRENVSTKVVYIKEPKIIPKETNSMIYIVPTVIMIIMIIYMLFKSIKY